MAASLAFGIPVHIAGMRVRNSLRKIGGASGCLSIEQRRWGRPVLSIDPAVTWLRSCLKSVRKFGVGVQRVPDSSGPFSLTTPHKVKTIAVSRKKTATKEPVVIAQASEGFSARWRSSTARFFLTNLFHNILNRVHRSILSIASYDLIWHRADLLCGG